MGIERNYTIRCFIVNDTETGRWGGLAFAVAAVLASGNSYT